MLLIGPAGDRQGVDKEQREAARIGARLRQQREVRRDCAQRGAGRFRVGEGCREAVRRTAGPLEHVTRIVGAVLDLVFRCERLHLRFRKFGTAGFREIAEGDELQRMAIGADLPVNLEAALQLRAIVMSEGTREGPRLPLRLRSGMRVTSGLRGARGKKCREAERGAERDEAESLDGHFRHFPSFSLGSLGFGSGGGTGRNRTGGTALHQHRVRDGRRQGLRRLEETQKRQDDQEEAEVISRQDA